MSTKKQELSHSSMNVEEVNKENYLTELMQRKQVEHSPFWIIGNEETGYCLVMGKYKLSENMKTIEEVENYLETDKWMVVVGTIASVALDIKENNGELERIVKET